MTVLNQATLKELLNYDPLTGVFTWKVTKGSRAKIGDTAGSLMKSGYVEIGVNGTSYLAHRLAVLYMTGAFPIDLVDHDDGDKQNNKWTNFNSVDKSGNAKNVALGARNTSGVLGVCWVTAKRKWKAQLRANCKTVHLGYFDNLLDAAAARKSADTRYGYHLNHGRIA